MTQIYFFFFWLYLYIYTCIPQWYAAKEFGIPKTTLDDRFRGKIADDARSGSSTVLPNTVEDEIVQQV